MCVCPEHQRWLVIEGGHQVTITTTIKSSNPKAITASFDEQEVTQTLVYVAFARDRYMGSIIDTLSDVHS